MCRRSVVNCGRIMVDLQRGAVNMPLLCRGAGLSARLRRAEGFSKVRLAATRADVGPGPERLLSSPRRAGSRHCRHRRPAHLATRPYHDQTIPGPVPDNTSPIIRQYQPPAPSPDDTRLPVSQYQPEQPAHQT